MQGGQLSYINAKCKAAVKLCHGSKEGFIDVSFSKLRQGSSQALLMRGGRQASSCERLQALSKSSPSQTLGGDPQHPGHLDALQHLEELQVTQIFFHPEHLEALPVKQVWAM